MAQLVFPAVADGLRVDVRVAHDRETLARLQVQPAAVPTSVEAIGLIDSGSDMTALAPTIVQQLGLRNNGQARSLSIRGWTMVDLYVVTLFVYDRSRPHLPWLDAIDLQVMELPSPLPQIDVLIGLDVLLQCKFLLDGPGRTFTLEF